MPAVLHDLAQRDGKIADDGLRETQEDLVVYCAGERGAIQLGDWQRYVELDN